MKYLFFFPCPSSLIYFFFFVMSAFGFITNSKTKNDANSSVLLSPSLAEDLYDSQQLNTFVNQSRTFTSTSSPPSPFRPFFPHPPPQKHKKPVQQSYFSFIDDLDSIEKPKSNTSLSGSSVVSQAEPLVKSAFGFIGQCKCKYFFFFCMNS